MQRFLAACLALPSICAPAFADQAAAVNPKTSLKPYSAPAVTGLGARDTAPFSKASPREAGEQKLARWRAALAQQKQAALATSPSAPAGAQTAANPIQLPTQASLIGSDDCSSALVIAGTGTFPFDTTGATTSSQQSGSCTTANLDVWFRWTAASSGPATLSLCGGTTQDTVIAAYNGAGCPSAPATACNDDACGLQSYISWQATAGTTYLLQIGSYSAVAASGSFSLTQAGGGGPANDDCSSASALAGFGPVTIDNTTATTGPQQNLPCGTGYAYDDVWFDWTCPTSGAAQVSLCGGVSFDTVLAVYAGSSCPIPGNAIACNDDSCGVQSEVLFPCVAGVHYLIQVGNFLSGSGNGGSGSFTISYVAPPANDDCNTPLALNGVGTFNYDLSFATTGGDGQHEPLCHSYGQTTIDRDLWFTWVAPASACTVVDNCLDSLDAKIAVYAGSGCPAYGSAIACSDDDCGFQARASFQAIAGQTYTIQFGTFPGAAFGAGTFEIQQTLPSGGNDDCATPAVIAGTGVFPFDNGPGFASTGCEGQREAACAAASFNMAAIESDLWYRWTAPATGFAIVDTCGLTTIDTKLAAYAGGACPASGSALACADDSCPGAQATLVFPCTAGARYMLQIGSAPSAAGGPGAFSLNVVLAPSNDNCATPIALGPTGPYSINGIGSTTGTAGQTNPMCGWFGMTAIDNDIWYTWTAPSTGRASLSLCAGSSFDSKVSVYAGAGCPAAGTGIACNDDACGLTSELCFDAVAGTTYTIQIGTFPGASNNYAGSFDIALGPPLPPCTWDDGTTENLLTWSQGGDLVWLNRFGSPGSSTLVSSVDVMWGSAMFPGYNPASNGQFATDVYIWQDGVSQDGNPSDATLLLTIPTTVSVWDTDTYVTLPIAPLSINGIFFVGSHQDNYGQSGAGPLQFVAPMDEDCPAPGVAWYFGNNSGYGTSPVDVAHPANNVQPPASFDSIGLRCQVCIRANCSAGSVTYLCDPGSGGTIACPCANPASGSQRGCNNSSATGGASIAGAGSNSLAAPTLAFTTAGERPVAASLLLQGTAASASGIVFGQGVRCVAGSLKRLFVKTASGGSILAPNLAGGDPSIPARSAALGAPILAGQSRWYMVYYRDPIVLGGCSAFATFNGTNTAQVLWQP